MKARSDTAMKQRRLFGIIAGPGRHNAGMFLGYLALRGAAVQYLPAKYGHQLDDWDGDDWQTPEQWRTWVAGDVTADRLVAMDDIEL